MKDHSPAELAAAVQRYEKDLWPRGHEAVLSSLENTYAVHDWKLMMSSPLMTGGLAREVPKEEQERAANGEGPAGEDVITEESNGTNGKA